MLNKSDHRVYELEHNQNAVQELAGKFEKTAEILKKLEERVQSLE